MQCIDDLSPSPVRFLVLEVTFGRERPSRLVDEHSASLVASASANWDSCVLPQEGALSMMQAVKALFTPQYKKQITIGIVLQIAQQLSGINAVMFYSSSIFRYVWFPPFRQSSYELCFANYFGS